MAERLFLGVGVYQTNEIRLTRSGSEVMITKNDTKTGEVCAETAAIEHCTGATADKSLSLPLFACEKPHKLLNPAVQRSKNQLQ
ncbi:MAG: hypothetical protein R6V03_05845 [Kiritimatiellia bacterium]